jgi:mannitol 2-dehydrogenase
MAVYLDWLMNAGLDHDWGIIGAGATYIDREVRKRLAPQDWLFSVIEQSAIRRDARVIGVMTEFLPVTDPDLCGFATIAEPEAAVARMADPAIRIVSMSGPSFYLGNYPEGVDADHPLIRREVTDGTPLTEVGMVIAGLRARRQAGIAPFTVLSNVDIADNGNAARTVIAGRAELSDPALAKWIREVVAFPNSMTDRIVVRPNIRRFDRIRDEFGFEDGCPVFSEDYIQWVVEDWFPAGRPAFEAAGATMVDDVAPFQAMKLRIMDGGQAIVAFAAALMGIHFVHQAMRHPLIFAFLKRVATEEIIPTCSKVPGTDLRDYLALVTRRLANPTLELAVHRIADDYSTRQADLIVPAITDRLARGLDVDGLALGSALCCRYCYVDANADGGLERYRPWEPFISAARAARSDPAAWLDMREIYGSAAEAPGFRQPFAAHLAALWRDGTEAALARYVAGLA